MYLLYWIIGTFKSKKPLLSTKKTSFLEIVGFIRPNGINDKTWTCKDGYNKNEKPAFAFRIQSNWYMLHGNQWA